MLRRTLGPGVEVEDLLQEVFLRALSRLGELPESAQLKPFVVAVTVRVLSRELKRRRTQRLLRLLRPWQMPEFAPAADRSALGALSAVYRILDELDVEARLAFTLRHFEGLALGELASAMDAPLPRAKRRLARANAHVQAALQADTAFNTYASVSLGEAL